jgi:hypothetical protein
MKRIPNKKILCLFGCLLITSVGFSQKNNWDFSVNAASAISWATISGDIKPDGAGFSYDFAVYAEKYFSNNFAYYAGLSFIRTAGQLKNVSTSDISLKSENLNLNTGQSAKYYIQYLTVPIGIKFKTRQYGRFLYYCQAGALPGVKISGSITVNRDKHSLFKDLNLMTCAVQLSSGLLYPVGEATFLKAGIIFESFFTDTFRASNMNVLPFSAGLQVGFAF